MWVADGLFLPLFEDIIRVDQVPANPEVWVSGDVDHRDDHVLCVDVRADSQGGTFRSPEQWNRVLL